MLNIYNILMADLHNSYAVCGIMGNLQAESALKANNLENRGNNALGISDEQYTLNVDNGMYSNWERDSYGYGLAQWTYYTRKRALLAFAKSKDCSIGDVRMQCEFLLHELRTNYKALYQQLQKCCTVKEASDAFCVQFERPANQSTSALANRQKLGEEIYKKLVSEVPSNPNDAFIKELDELLQRWGYRHS